MKETPDDDILEQIHRIMHRYKAEQFRALRDGPLGITHMDGKVLSYIGHHPGSTQSELSELIGRDRAQLARLIKGLRDLGLLHGEVDADDRRNVRLSLTVEGEAVRKAIRQQGRRLSAKAVSQLDDAEQAQLRTLLARVMAALDSPTI
jgi:DNA-binding MarR family transcriptional regulator